MPAMSANSVCVITDRSGSPTRDPVAPDPARYKKSKPTVDATLVEMPSKTPGPIRHFPIGRRNVNATGRKPASKGFVLTFFESLPELLGATLADFLHVKALALDVARLVYYAVEGPVGGKK